MRACFVIRSAQRWKQVEGSALHRDWPGAGRQRKSADSCQRICRSRGRAVVGPEGRRVENAPMTGETRQRTEAMRVVRPVADVPPGCVVPQNSFPRPPVCICNTDGTDDTDDTDSLTAKYAKYTKTDPILGFLSCALRISRLKLSI